MIGIINYGTGNLNAISHSYRKLGLAHKIVNSKVDLIGITKLILPGVGSFDTVMKKLNDSGLREPLTELVLDKGIPILGICVGLQVFFEESEEGKERGLGWIKGNVYRLSSNSNYLPLPHLGWNDIDIVNSDKISQIKLNKNDKNIFYFLHSFIVRPTDSRVIYAKTFYGINFPSIICYKNIIGTQFHPEKSHKSGNLFLKNFGSSIC